MTSNLVKRHHITSSDDHRDEYCHRHSNQPAKYHKTQMKVVSVLLLFMAAIAFFVLGAAYQFLRLQIEFEATDVISTLNSQTKLPDTIRKNITLAEFRKLPPFLHPFSDIIHHSDTIVQLSHCDLNTFNEQDWKNFTMWSMPIMNQVFYQNSKFKDFLLPLPEHTKTNDDDMTYNKEMSHDVEKEFLLQLLEIYLTQELQTHGIFCNYDKYRFHNVRTVEKNQTFQQAQRKLNYLKKLPTNHTDKSNSSTDRYSKNDVRIVYSIVAFQDFAHLKRLIDSIILPQHVVIIHVEHSAPTSFVNQIKNQIITSQKYDNVILLKFGTVVYETDSVSQIQLEIMEWLVKDVQWEYDYHITLGGAIFPLFSARELHDHILTMRSSTNQRRKQPDAPFHQVWLGELLHGGKTVHHPQSSLIWNRKRLYSTITSIDTAVGETRTVNNVKYNARAGSNIISTPVPNWLDHAMQHKSTSGNQGVFSRDVVKELVSNTKIKELFALAKYSCCCCIEERTWIAAMDILGLLDQAKSQYSMYQVWGGYKYEDTQKTTSSTTCSRGGMKNAILEWSDQSYISCYRSEHAYKASVKHTQTMTESDDHFYSNKATIWNELVEAKARGILFARKFHSDNPKSLQLLKRIVNELHR